MNHIGHPPRSQHWISFPILDVAQPLLTPSPSLAPQNRVTGRDEQIGSTRMSRVKRLRHGPGLMENWGGWELEAPSRLEKPRQLSILSVKVGHSTIAFV